MIDLSDALGVVSFDEADEMLDMGFFEDFEFILDHSPYRSPQGCCSRPRCPAASPSLAQTYPEPGRAPDRGRPIREAQHSVYRLSCADLLAPLRTSETAIINLLR